MFSLHIRGALYPEVEKLLGRLESSREEIAQDLFDSLRREVPGLAAGEDLRQHCQDHARAFLETVRSAIVPRGPEAEFVVRFGRRGARQGHDLELLLRGYRTNGHTFVHWVSEQGSAATRDSLRAALAVTRMVMEYTDSVSATLAEAYLHETERLLVESGSLQRDLLEDLLAGRGAGDAGLIAAGLEPGKPLQLAVVSAAGLPEASEAIGDQFRMARLRGLRVVRHEELILVVAAPASLRQMLIRAAEREPLTAGISLPTEELSQFPRAHAEARKALALAPLGGVLRPADLSLFDYLLAGADETAPRLGPQGLEKLKPHLKATLLAYAAADLNVGAAARRLHLHQNTVHYRLRQVESLTGSDLRHLDDVIDLLAALRLAPDNGVGRPNDVSRDTIRSLGRPKRG